jgi:5'(3')-deoxyribonucleotidase
VLGDFVSGARRWADDRHDMLVTDDQITDYNVMTSLGLPDGWPSFIEWLSDMRFCRDMPVYPGAREFVAALRGFGEIVAVTTPFVGVDHWEADRRGWLNTHFGIGHDNVVFCKRKELVCGDVLVEDKPDNALAWGAAWPKGWPILLRRPWNRVGLDGYYEAVGFESVLEIVAGRAKAAGGKAAE